MVRYPTAYSPAKGLIRDPGPAGQPGVDTLSVIRAFNIPDTFEEPALIEAREQAKLFNEDEIGGRLDLRAVLTVTIDPAQPPATSTTPFRCRVTRRAIGA